MTYEPRCRRLGWESEVKAVALSSSKGTARRLVVFSTRKPIMADRQETRPASATTTTTLSIDLTPDEMAALQRLADLSGKSLEDTLLAAIRLYGLGKSEDGQKIRVDSRETGW